ncbi:MAG: molybdopterin-dependent oxidoreductase [Planctomycetota bacterium]
MTDQPTPLTDASRQATEARGETFFAGPSGIHLASFPPRERWDDWTELDSRAWPERKTHRYQLVPTTCFNCESACGLLAYIDKETGQVRKFEGNPEHPGSRGRNCAKGPATLNQVQDPDRILYPLRRTGRRGEGQWQRISWDAALDEIAGRIRKALDDKRHNEVIYHVGRPGEDGFTERVLAAWGLDGHNSHTNICSSAARAGYHYWMGLDRPSPDFANARTILLVSSHLEAGHYFNPHAQRITEARERGAKLVVFDVRLSNTATHADHWVSPYPGTEAAIFLAIASWLLEHDRYDREYVRRWWNWQEYLEAAGLERSFEVFETRLKELYRPYTLEYAARESGVSAAVIEQIAELVASSGTALSTHNWRSAAAGNLGGWQVSRTLFMLNALMGAIATPGGVFPNAWTKFVPRPIHTPPHPKVWNTTNWPEDYPLALHEMSFLLPQLIKDGRGVIDTYFTRVYNPVWTNPDGFSWIEMLTDEKLVGLHVALTPTWNETAYFADMILPMGVGSERHDIHSYETHDAAWIGFRQPVQRAAKERNGETVSDTRGCNPGEVWEENEFWIELSWRLDPDGSRGIRQYFESKATPGEKLGVDEYYGWLFQHSVPGLPEAAAEAGCSPLEFMRRRGAFDVQRGVGQVHEQEVPDSEREDLHTDALGRVFTRAAKPAGPNVVPQPTPPGDADGRRLVGVQQGEKIVRGWPTPSGKLEFYSSVLAAWGWPEFALPTYIRSHIHRDEIAADQMPLIPTFRLPVQIHTRSANSKWLDEIAHTNPLWIHPSDARRLGIAKTGDLARVTTLTGHFVVRCWITEGIRPGVVACSHHMGRWKVKSPNVQDPTQTGQRQLMATVDLKHEAGRWSLRRLMGAAPYASSDPDTQRIWWTDVGVHQNLTFCVQPDPISGAHCWHQAVTVTAAQPGDQHGDISVDPAKAREQYLAWLKKTRGAREVSPDGTRRPYWLLRPLKPHPDAYQLPAEAGV